MKNKKNMKKNIKTTPRPSRQCTHLRLDGRVKLLDQDGQRRRQRLPAGVVHVAG